MSLTNNSITPSPPLPLTHLPPPSQTPSLPHLSSSSPSIVGINSSLSAGAAVATIMNNNSNQLYHHQQQQQPIHNPSFIPPGVGNGNFNQQNINFIQPDSIEKQQQQAPHHQALHNAPYPMYMHDPNYLHQNHNRSLSPESHLQDPNAGLGGVYVNNSHFPLNQQYYGVPHPHHSHPPNSAYLAHQQYNPQQQQQFLQYQQQQHYQQQMLQQQQQVGNPGYSLIFDDTYTSYQAHGAPGTVSPAMYGSLSPCNANGPSGFFHHGNALPYPIEPLSVTESDNSGVISNDMDSDLQTTSIEAAFADEMFSFDGIKLSPSNSQKKRRRSTKPRGFSSNSITSMESGTEKISSALTNEEGPNKRLILRSNTNDEDDDEKGSGHDDDDDEEFDDDTVATTPNATSEKSGTEADKDDSEKKTKKNRRASVITSPYRGVSCCGKDKKWQVRIRDGKKALYLGRYNYEIEAALKYDEAARTLKAQVPATNFIDLVAIDQGLHNLILKEGIEHGFLPPEYYKYLDPYVLEKMLKFPDRCQNRNSKASSLASALANRDAIAVAAAKSQNVAMNSGTKRDQSQITE